MLDALARPCQTGKATVVLAAVPQLRPGIWPRRRIEHPVALDCPSLTGSITTDKEKLLRTNLCPSPNLKVGIHADSGWLLVFWQLDSPRRILKKELFFSPKEIPGCLPFFLLPKSAVILPSICKGRALIEMESDPATVWSNNRRESDLSCPSKPKCRRVRIPVRGKNASC